MENVSKNYREEWIERIFYSSKFEFENRLLRNGNKNCI